MIFQSFLCLLAFGITLSSAQLCLIVLDGGECVSKSNPCPAGKVQSDVYNCGSSELQCCYTPAIPPSTVPPTTPTPPEPSCGVKSVTSRIFGGNDVNDACKWPWAVRIRTRVYGDTEPATLDNTNPACNGVLVGPDLVMTSACCIQNAALLAGATTPVHESLMVVAGEYDVGKYDFQGTGLREKFVSVSAAYTHPDNTFADIATFTGANFLDESRADYNIAVLKLSSSVELGNCIEIACLPTMDDIADLTPNDMYSLPCHIASWGRYTTSVDDSVVLRDAAFNIYPEPICPLVDPTIRPGSGCGRADDNMKGVCSGDDGGMVICQDPNTDVYKLFGLINYCKTEQCMPPTGNNVIPISNLRDNATMTWINKIINGVI